MSFECRHRASTPCWKLEAFPVVNGELLPSSALTTGNGPEIIDQVLFFADREATTQVHSSDLVELADQFGGDVAGPILNETGTWGSASRGMRDLHARTIAEAASKAIVMRLVNVEASPGDLSLSGHECQVMALLALGYNKTRIEEVLSLWPFQVDAVIDRVIERTGNDSQEKTILTLFQLGRFGIDASHTSTVEVTDGVVSSNALPFRGPIASEFEEDFPYDQLDIAAESYRFSRQEKTALRHRLEGLSNSSVATRMEKSNTTVVNLIRSCFRKLEVRNISQAAVTMSGVNMQEWLPAKSLFLDAIEWIVVQGWVEGRAQIESERQIGSMLGRTLTPDDMATINRGLITKLGARNQVHALWLVLIAKDEPES